MQTPRSRTVGRKLPPTNLLNQTQPAELDAKNGKEAQESSLRLEIAELVCRQPFRNSVIGGQATNDA